jgi:O-antigen/teichoic acid export membrane protein
VSGVKSLTASRLARAGSLLTVLNLATGVIGYLFQVLMGRLLLREDFSIFNVLMAVVMVACSPLAAFGLVLTRQVAVIRAAGDNGRLRGLYRIMGERLLLASVAGLGLLYLCSPVVRQYLRIRDDVTLWLFGVILVLTAGIFLNNAFLQGLQRFGWLGGLGVGAAVIKCVLGVWFVTTCGWGLHGALGGVLATMVCVGLAGAWSIVQGAVGRGSRDQGMPPFAVRLLAPLVAGNVAFVAMTQLDIVLVNHYFEPDVSSQYTAASILGKAVLYLPVGIATAIYPMVVENRARGQGSRDIVAQSLTSTLLLCSVAALVYRVAGASVVTGLFGAGYAQAGPLLAMYGLAMVPMGVAIVVKHVLIARGHALFVWLFVAAAAVEVAVIHVWHPSLEAVVAVIALCNALLAGIGCCLVAFALDAGHTDSTP